MTTLREHVDAVIASEGWCRVGAKIVQERDPDTAIWYGQVDKFQGFLNVWWIANPTAAQGFVLLVVEDMVDNMAPCDARGLLGAMSAGTADLGECIAWCEANNAQTECCNLVGKLATALGGGSAVRRYGMLRTLLRASSSVHGVSLEDTDAVLLESARAAAPLDVWRGSFE